MIQVEINVCTDADIKISLNREFSIYLYLFFEPKFKAFMGRIKTDLEFLTQREWKNINMMLAFPLIQEELCIHCKDYSYISYWQSELFDKEEMDTYTATDNNEYIYLRQSRCKFLDCNLFISKLKAFA